MVAPINFEVLPGLLRGDELRNWLKTDAQALLLSFDTQSSALDYLRSGGVAIRTADFNDIYKQVQSRRESIEQVSGLPSNENIPLAFTDGAHGLDLQSKFLYNIKLYGYDQNTGVVKSQWMGVASERQLTPDEVREVARSYVGEGGVSGEIYDFRFGEIEPLRR